MKHGKIRFGESLSRRCTWDDLSWRWRPESFTCWMMIIGGFAIQYIGDCHDPWRESHLTAAPCHQRSHRVALLRSWRHSIWRCWYYFAGFLSHGGTSKSSIWDWEFPLPSSYWGPPFMETSIYLLNSFNKLNVCNNLLGESSVTTKCDFPEMQMAGRNLWSNSSFWNRKERTFFSSSVCTFANLWLTFRFTLVFFDCAIHINYLAVHPT